MSHFDFDEAFEQLEVPHQPGCDYYDVDANLSASAFQGELTLEKSCWNCQGRDHLKFDIGEYDVSGEYSFEVGERFDVTEYVSADISVRDGDEVCITAIADNPLYADEKHIVGLRSVEDDPPYSVTILSVGRFEELVDDGVFV